MELDFENLHLEARGVSLQLHVLFSDLGRAARGTAGRELTHVAQTPAPGVPQYPQRAGCPPHARRLGGRRAILYLSTFCGHGHLL